ncbi:hypothetical protein MTO96_051061 [Rhipicephalus appendiculatus]
MVPFGQEHVKQLTEGLRIPQVVRSAQGVAVSGEEALLMTLRRLSYPNRWYDIEPLFGRASSTMSIIVSQVMAHIDRALTVTVAPARRPQDPHMAHS